MGEALVGAMVAAMRRANRDRADEARAAQLEAPARSEGTVVADDSAAPCGRGAERCVAGTSSSGAAWGYLAHPALMPTVYSPSGDASDDAGEEVAASKV